MPIRRRDETTDSLDKYIALIWTRKWLIIAVAIFAGVATYIALLFVPETYRVKSEIYVNRLPTTANEETASPDTVTSLLKSQSVIEEVRNDYVEAFDVQTAPPVEKFAKQFDVESYILQDTTVRKQFSPVLTLQVESSGAEETRFIMQRWIENFIEQYGNYTTKEALVKRDAYSNEIQRVEDEIVRVERERAKYDSQLPYLKKMLAEKLELLTPSRLSFQDRDVDTIKLDFQIQNPRMRPGLLERYAELKLQMNSGSAPTTAAAELKAMETAIADANTSIAGAEKDLAEIRYHQLRTIRELELLTGTQKAINDTLARFTVASAVYTTATEDGLPTGGDIRAMATPVMPETRVWPKRTLSAGIAAIVAAILTIFALIARNFLTKISAPTTQ